MGRVTLQEFRLADLHTTSTTARHGSEKLGSKFAGLMPQRTDTKQLSPVCIQSKADANSDETVVIKTLSIS